MQLSLTFHLKGFFDIKLKSTFFLICCLPVMQSPEIEENIFSPLDISPVFINEDMVEKNNLWSL